MKNTLPPTERALALDEAMQLAQVTLASIANDLGGTSTRAAEALEEAVANIERAREEFARATGEPVTGAAWAAAC